MTNDTFQSDPQPRQDAWLAKYARVTPLEDEFSATLGQGARWINRVLSFATLLASGLLLFMGIGLSSAVLKQIRNSEEKYRNLINTANDGILVIDARNPSDSRGQRQGMRNPRLL